MVCVLCVWCGVCVLVCGVCVMVMVVVVVCVCGVCVCVGCVCVCWYVVCVCDGGGSGMCVWCVCYVCGVVCVCVCSLLSLILFLKTSSMTYSMFGVFCDTYNFTLPVLNEPA